MRSLEALQALEALRRDGDTWRVNSPAGSLTCSQVLSGPLGLLKEYPEPIPEGPSAILTEFLSSQAATQIARFLAAETASSLQNPTPPHNPIHKSKQSEKN